MKQDSTGRHSQRRLARRHGYLRNGPVAEHLRRHCC